jgi:hypothetical protein
VHELPTPFFGIAGEVLAGWSRPTTRSWTCTAIRHVPVSATATPGRHPRLDHGRGVTPESRWLSRCKPSSARLSQPGNLGSAGLTSIIGPVRSRRLTGKSGAKC